MKLFEHILIVLLEAPLALFVPGFVLVRPLTLDPAERTASSVAVSIFVLYVYSLLVFVLKLPWAAHWLFAAGCIIAAWYCWRELRAFCLLLEVRRLVLSFAFLLIWTFAAVGFISNYSGGDWVGDWYEHYHRALFFLHHLPIGTMFLSRWTLTDRPPLFNLVTGHFLAVAGEGYPIYQVASLLLNLTVFFPASLFFRQIWPRSTTGPLPLALVMCLSPVIIQNATYPWTKLLTVSYLLLGLWFYCRSLSKGDGRSVYLAFFAVSAALLTHYSAGPYAVVLAAHYLWRRLREPRWRELARLLVMSVLILATWFGWSLAHYNSRVAFGSNTSVPHDASHVPVETVKTIGGNFRDTLVPPFLRANDPGRNYEFTLATVHDYAFQVYQSNLFLMLGTVGWFIAILEAATLARGATDKSLLYFWTLFISGSVILAIGVVGESHPWGVAHLDLQPVVLLGLILVAAAWPTLAKPLRALMILGLICDFSLGVALHLGCERWSTPWNDLYTVGYFNWQIKQGHYLSFIGDSRLGPALCGELLALCFVFYLIYRNRDAQPETMNRDLASRA